MKSKAVVALSLAVSALILAQSLLCAVANFTPLPELPAPIFIRADGTVEPASAPIQRDEDTYTLTGDVNNTIEIQCPNIVLDGGGFKVTRPDVNTVGLMMPVGWLPGVHVEGTSNVKITNVVFDGCVTGVSIENATDVTVSQNTMRNCNSGVVVLSSSQVDIVGNRIRIPNESFAVGINLLPLNPDSSNPNRIRIIGNQIVGSLTAAPVPPVPQPDQHGIWGTYSDSQITSNSLTRIDGIALYNMASNNLVADNNFSENNEAVLVNIDPAGFFGNTFCGNNFDRNLVNVNIPYIRNYGAESNRWDNGSVGNYWSDYTGGDGNLDGVGDTPYLLQTTYPDYEQQTNVTVLEGQDNYPAMAPFNLSGIPDQSAGPVGTTAEPFPLVLAAVVLAALILAGAGLAVYLRKRRKPASSASEVDFGLVQKPCVS
ncbi:MAG: right-handed parallel beta-helix repeat-containing protein [Candidatus Bathyarchaeota archaeon]|nr:right-handed parallel beta-helix repeat-containing protein [Candidatus Bathyarchaeota archaeon]